MIAQTMLGAIGQELQCVVNRYGENPELLTFWAGRSVRNDERKGYLPFQASLPCSEKAVRISGTAST